MREYRLNNTPDDKLLSEGIWNRLVKERSNYFCERCGANPNFDLEAHHKDRDRENNRLNNGECLCKKCHTAEHRKLRAIENSKLTPSGFLQKLLKVN